MGGILGFDSNKTSTVNTQTSIADSFNTSNSTVNTKENLGNTALSFGATGGVANIGTILAAGFVLAGLALLTRKGGS